MSKTRGAFIYPPSNTSLVFNYLDTVNVTWNTYAKYTANASLQLLIAEGAKNDFIPGMRYERWLTHLYHLRCRTDLDLYPQSTEQMSLQAALPPFL